MFLGQIINYGIFIAMNILIMIFMKSDGEVMPGMTLGPTSSPEVIALLLALIFCFGSTILMRAKFLTSPIAKYIFAAAGIVWNMVGTNVTGFLASYAACFVIMTMITIYVDLKLTIAVNASLGSYIVYVAIKEMNAGTLSFFDAGMPLLAIILTMIGACLITKLFISLFEEQIHDINAKNEIQKVLIRTVSDATDEVSKKYDTVMEGLSEITEQVECNRLSMHGISDDMVTTANGIQNQVLSTNEIQEKLQEAEKSAEKIEFAVEKVFTNIVDGLKNADSLTIQAQNIDDKTREMSDIIIQLSNRVQDVSGIVETILSISQQTNLLALNASIEAARAGEAGRGFSVVAEQIRLLSESTKVSTTQITDIIHELQMTTESTHTILEESITNIHANSENANKVNQNFTDTGKNMDLLKSLVDEINRDIKMIFNSNEIIVNSVTQLSDITESVSETAHTGVESNDKIITSMEWLNQNMDDINKEIESLKQLIASKE